MATIVTVLLVMVLSWLALLLPLFVVAVQGLVDGGFSASKDDVESKMSSYTFLYLSDLHIDLEYSAERDSTTFCREPQPDADLTCNTKVRQ